MVPNDEKYINSQAPKSWANPRALERNTPSINRLSRTAQQFELETWILAAESNVTR